MTDAGIRVKVDGEASFKTAVKSIDSQIKELNAEMKAAVTSMSGMASGEEKTAQKSRILADQVDKNKQKLALLTDQYDKAKTQLDRLGAELDQAKAKEGDNTAEVTKATNAYNRQVQEVSKLGRQIHDTNSAIGQQEAELERLNNKMLQSGKRMQELGKKIQSVGQSMSKIGSSATRYITLPLLAAGTAAAKITGDFDASMSKVQALSGATGKEFDSLREKARALGADTKFSASESADALANMALAGWNTKQMLTGIDGVLDLAAASGMDLAKSADVVAGNLAAFNMKAEESTRLADLIATAQAKSKTTADQLAEAYSTSATNMTQAGQAAETTTALLEGLASVNDTGSAAGTKLSAVMAQITKKMKNGKIQIGDTSVAVQDANGNFRDMIDIVEDVEKATYGMGDAERAAALQTTFNRQSMNGLNELLAVGSTQLRKYRSELENSTGSAAKMAETMQDNLMGQLTILKSQLQELAISFGDTMMPSIRKFVGSLQDGVDTLNSMDESTREMILKVGLATAAFGPATKAASKFTTGLGFVIEKAGKVTSALSSGSGVASALTSSLSTGGAAGLAIAGVTVLTGATIALSEKLRQATDPVIQIKKHIEAMVEAQEKLSVSKNVIELATRYEELRAKLSDTTLSSEDLASAQAELEEVRAALSEATDGAISKEGEYNSELDKTVQKQKELAEEDQKRANLELYTELVKGTKDYNNALEKQVIKKNEIAKAEQEVAHYSSELSEATGKATEEMNNNGKVSLKTKFAMDAAASSLSGATKGYNRLTDELEELEDVTREHEKSVISLVRNGFLKAEDAATLLGISEEGVRRKTLALEQQELSASNATKDKAEASLEAAEAAQAQADAEEEAATSLSDISAAAEQAITSGGDLRETYDELKKKLDEAKEAGDAQAVAEAELALANLNLAATNQELAETYPSLVDTAKTYGLTISDVSQWLIDNELTAEEWAGRVTAASDNVMNGFKKLDTSLDMSLSEMQTSLESNISAYENWNTNIGQLMSAAEAIFRETGDRSAIDFVSYMQRMGTGAADQVAAMVENMGWTMETFPPLMAQATQQGMLSVYNEVENSKAGISDATGSVMDGAAGKIGETDLGTPAKTAAAEIPAAISDSAPAVREAAQGLAMEAHSAIAQVGWADLGEAVGTGISNGLTGQSVAIQTAAQGLAQMVSDAWTKSAAKFIQSGTTAGTNIRTGLTSQKASVSTASRSLAAAAQSVWTSFNAQFRQSGLSAASAVASGIGSGSATVAAAARSVVLSGYSAMQISGWYNIGFNISAGVASGVRSGSYLISNAARAAAKSALSSAKSTLGIHSPSKVFRDEVGKMIPEGIALGVQDSANRVSKAMDSLSGRMTASVSANLDAAGGGSASKNYTHNATINVYGAPGQDVDALADVVMRKWTHSVAAKEAGL